MNPYLFGDQFLTSYDFIGILGYIILFLFLFFNKSRFYADASLSAPSTKPARWLAFVVLLTVHLVTYTFAGMRVGVWLGRATEFFGYVGISAVGMVLAAVTMGFSPLKWLDRTVPLYLLLAATLKTSCFCAGCCYGLPWAHGLYNARMDQTQFPIQLVEMAAYAVLLCLLCRYRGRDGQRFALFVAGYAAIRFGVQFFRGDRAVFSAFHWMSAVFAAIGVAMWVICALFWRKKEHT